MARPTHIAIGPGACVLVWLPAFAGTTGTGGVLTDRNTLNGFFPLTTALQSFQAEKSCIRLVQFSRLNDRPPVAQGKKPLADTLAVRCANASVLPLLPQKRRKLFGQFRMLQSELDRRF